MVEHVIPQIPTTAAERQLMRELSERPCTTVTLFNSHARTTQVIYDRTGRGHELQPGQRKRGISMYNDDIEHLQRLRSPGNSDPTDPLHKGGPFPPHPVIVEDIPQPQERERELAGAGGGERQHKRN